jgi:antirestriction protein ArdC
MNGLDLQVANPADRLKEIMDKLEQGVADLFESGRYEAYLRTMAKFHQYSANNTILIFLQKPDASHVAGYSAWRDRFKRQVKKGETGIRIIAPAPFERTVQVDRLDALGQPILDPDGEPARKEVDITVPGFKVVSVFDISQTEGKELPTIGASELTGSVDRYDDFFTALERTSAVPIAFEKIETGANGYYHLTEKRIALQSGMSQLQTLKTAIHEIAHSRLHAEIDAPKGGPPRADRRTREVQAESVAFCVCQRYGLDTSDYSFGYIAGWSGGKQIHELKASLETIHEEAGAMIKEIDEHLAQLQKDREREAKAPAQEALKTTRAARKGATPQTEYGQDVAAIKEDVKAGRTVSLTDLADAIKAGAPTIHVKTAREALTASLSEKAHVDLAYMSKLTGRSEETLKTELAGVVFLNIGGAYTQDKTYVTADEYLSGDLREKLVLAKAAQACVHSGVFDRNVEALQAALSGDSAAEISARIQQAIGAAHWDRAGKTAAPTHPRRPEEMRTR